MAQEITIVTGLPRSGTSMMMKMLEAGGMPVATDQERKADEDNPKGYYELEVVKKIEQDTSWLAGLSGKAVKMVSMLLYHLPKDHDYRIVFMRRDLDEMLESQRVMLARKGEGADFDAAQMKALYLKHLREIEGWLAGQANMRVLQVQYRQVLDEPPRIVDEINRFFDGRLRADAMVQVVDRMLYRQRGAERPAAAPAASGTEAPIGAQEQSQIEAQLKSLGYM